MTVAFAAAAPLQQSLAGPPAGEWAYGLLSNICHQYPSRSFWVMDRPLALCIRCVGGYLGVVASAGALMLLPRFRVRTQVATGLGLLALGVLEASMSLIGGYEGVPLARFCSGLLGGLGFALLIAPVTPMKQPKGRDSMKMAFVAVAAFGLLVQAVPAGAESPGGKSKRLRNGTVVVIKTQEQLSGGKLKAGQEVVLVVAMPVVVDGVTVIPAGASATGFVQDAEGSQMAGVGGNLTISLRSVTAIDGTSVPLSGQFLAKGEDQVGRNVAVGVILCPFILLDKGGDAVIPTGAETRGLTIGDYDIGIDGRTSQNSSRSV